MTPEEKQRSLQMAIAIALLSVAAVYYAFFIGVEVMR